MNTTTNRISFTQYKMWSECPLRWKLAYPDHLREEIPNINLMFGTAMHEVIQEWLTEYVYGGSTLAAQTVDLTDTLKLKLMEQFQEKTVEVDGVKQFPCDKGDLIEFYMDGVAILKYLQNNIHKHFNDEWALEEIEMSVEQEIRPGVMFVGYLDIVLRHKLTGLYRIVDLKTSTWGWAHWARNDKTKTNQLLFYKKFLSEANEISEDYIAVEYIILKRKLRPVSTYPQYRVTTFSPAHGKPSMKKAIASLDEFLDSCFKEDGSYNTDNIEATPSKSACKFCPFNDQKDLCSVGIIS